jgi:cobalt/nickel transport system permease protein
MHIDDYILSAPALGALTAGAAAGVALGLRRLHPDRLPRVAVLSSAFFVAGLIHVPLPPTSVHLVLTGLIGMVLGWAAFPAILVGLVLQAVMFGHGGITTLGVNTFIMAAPAVCVYYAFGRDLGRRTERGSIMIRGFTAGFTAVLLSGALATAALWASDQTALAGTFMVSHVVLAMVEGLVTAHALAFLHLVRPETLQAAPTLTPAVEPADG